MRHHQCYQTREYSFSLAMLSMKSKGSQCSKHERRGYDCTYILATGRAVVAAAAFDVAVAASAPNSAPTMLVAAARSEAVDDSYWPRFHLPQRCPSAAAKYVIVESRTTDELANCAERNTRETPIYGCC